MGDGANSIPGGADVYAVPSGFCGPSFDDPTAVLPLAGTAVRFSALRIIASEYGKRVFDALVPVADLDTFLLGLGSEQRQTLRAAIGNMTGARPAMTLSHDRHLRFERPLIMGILNVTPDSFSDGGKHLDVGAAIAHGEAMAHAGTHILDIGGESTRPGAKPVWEGDELARVVPVIEALALSGHVISIDTRKAAVMRAALSAGAVILNDVSALSHDADSLQVAAEADCPVVLMHAQGDPTVMQKDPRYDDALLDIYDWLKDRVESCVAAGIERHRLIVDPGIGFGKSVRHNLDLLNGLAIFHGLGCPVLFGASRKRFIGALSGVEDASLRMPGSLAAAFMALDAGAHILRVHDVPETVQALAVWRGARDAAQLPASL